jgi:hypothetical protein
MNWKVKKGEVRTNFGAGTDLTQSMTVDDDDTFKYID